MKPEKQLSAEEQKKLNSELFNEIIAGNGTEASAEKIKKLIEGGAEVGARTGEMENTPLHLAASLGNKRAVDLLIANGADINARDKFEKTPLHITTRKYDYTTSKLLLDSGADINAQDKFGNTPLHNVIGNEYSSGETKIRKNISRISSKVDTSETQRQEMSKLFLRNDKIDTSLKNEEGDSAENLICNGNRDTNTCKELYHELQGKHKKSAEFNKNWSNFQYETYDEFKKNDISEKKLIERSFGEGAITAKKASDSAVNELEATTKSSDSHAKKEVSINTIDELAATAKSSDSQVAATKKGDGLVSMFFRKVGELFGLTKKEDEVSLFKNQERSDNPTVNTEAHVKKTKMEELVVGNQVESPLHNSSNESITSKIGENDMDELKRIRQSLQQGNSKTIDDEVRSPLHSHVDSVAHNTGSTHGGARQ